MFQLIVGSVSSFNLVSYWKLPCLPTTGPQRPYFFSLMGWQHQPAGWSLLEDVMTFNSLLQSCAVTMTLGRLLVLGIGWGKLFNKGMRCQKCWFSRYQERRFSFPRLKAGGLAEASLVDAPERVVASKKCPGNGQWPRMCSSRWESAKWPAASSPRRSVWLQRGLP